MAALEFALTMPILLLVLVGIVELSLLMHRVNVVSRVARDASRVGSMVIEGMNPTGDQTEAAAIAHARFALQAAGVDCTGGCEVQAEWFELEEWHLLRVAIDAPYDPVMGAFPLVPDSVHGAFVSMTQQQMVEAP